MDPLSLSAGIIAVLQLSGTLVSYLNSVQSATKDQAYLAVEVSNLYSLLTALKYRVEEAFASDPSLKDPWFTAVSILGTEDGPLDQTKQALERLANRIEPVRGVKKVVRQLLWKLEQAECLDILSKIERLKSLINLALTNDLFSLSQAIKHDISDIGTELAALRLGHQEEEIASIQSWLSPLDFRSRQQEIFRGRQEGTRQWLFESHEFQSWVSAPGGTLWCPGIPGAGKTVTSSIIFDYLRRDSQRQNASVACLFCNYRDRADQSAETFMANLLKQVIQDQPKLSEDVKRIYLCHRPKRPTFAETAEAFRNEIKRFSKVFVIIDALDETTDNDDIRTLLLSELESLPIHLLVTSRHDTIIERRFDHAQCLEIRATDGDVQTYVKARIATEKILLRHIERNPSLEERILKTVVDKSKKMFHMDSLVTKTKPKDVRNALDSLPPGLDESYYETLKRIESQVPEYVTLAKRILFWTCKTFEPLSPSALQHALAVEPDMTEIDDEDLDDEDLILSVCAGLVILDKESNTLRFVHYTTQEYFERNAKYLFGDVHMRIAVSCLTYINLGVFDDGPCVSTSVSETSVELRMNHDLPTRLLRYPFYRYASSHWAGHIRGLPELACMEPILSFLRQQNKLSSMLEANAHNFPIAVGLNAHHPSVHVAAFYGLSHVVNDLLRSGTPAGSHDFDLPTPLILASGQGHEDIVRLLLAQEDVDINFQWHHGMTSLLTAVECRHTGIIRILLQDGADVNLRCWKGTALMLAAKTRNEPAVQLLMDCGVRNSGIDPADEDSSLFEDLCDSSLATLQIVLEKVRDPYLINKIPIVTVVGLCRYGRRREHTEAILRLLLGKGANVHDRDNLGRTPVHKAVRYDNLSLLKFLVEKAGANVSEKDNEGCTPLFEANSKVVISYLVEHGVDPEEVDLTGLNALEYADALAYSGHIKLVESLRADL